MKQVKTVCPRDCPDSCFLTVTVREGRIASTRGDPDHPVTRGFTCPRGVADKERVYSEDRILYPHLPEGSKQDRGFKRTSWDEALDVVSNRLRRVIDNYGADRVLQLDYAGNTGLLSYPFFQRIWNALGATGHDSSLCSGSGHAALALHYGLSYGLQPEELPGMKFITFWGFNAMVSSIHQWALALKAREDSGSTLVVVDPRESETARRADVWMNPEDAEAIGARDGDPVSLKNELGKVSVRVRVTDRVPRGILWSPRLLTGLNGTPQNTLFPSTTQELGGGPVFNSTRVEIEAGGPKD